MGVKWKKIIQQKMWPPRAWAIINRRNQAQISPITLTITISNQFYCVAYFIGLFLFESLFIVMVHKLQKSLQTCFEKSILLGLELLVNWVICARFGAKYSRFGGKIEIGVFIFFFKAIRRRGNATAATQFRLPTL